ncbi:IS91 family transposase [Lichenibacterium minor]|uniref:IS91 family transposase n=1 Tax=Lichenibacterium minor TaxID=2316528 RepID=A0A4Q2TZN8_9HYPH|nr:IS91 family transposase [Lichenibacterium minor]RYC29240.1 IS91 family transposase [Lichenibacterium minor]
MSRPHLEIADILRRHGVAWRAAQAGHVSLGQLKVMSAIETCRTAALGGHVEACEGCRHTRVAYNSCRNRHCPKCQGAAAREWLAARAADLLPVGYFHVLFTVPAEIADIAFTNKAPVYDLLFRAASETMLTIAADPRHLGARIGITAVLHTWGSALTHHPHVRMIVPGGGISLDSTRWVSSRPAFLLPVHVLGKLFRRLFLTGLTALHVAGRLRFFGDRAGLSDPQAFERHLAPVRAAKWVVYSKPPFDGPEAVLAYLSRYTHHVAISNRRLIGMDQDGITFRYKDYRRDGDARHRTMTLWADEFIRRFLVHVLPRGFHRIRHYGLLATGRCKANIARARELLAVPAPPVVPKPASSAERRTLCPCCGGRMLMIESFKGTVRARAPPSHRWRAG